ncbi:MAG TPA: carboxypeptidase-like regulatory domain-containing protein [Planctomycetota bacterium]|nr:carboxypeptidase-like regulatory domain-containing protein [Planctomycetota bacterium]
MRSFVRRCITVLFAVALVAISYRAALALIEGGEGNTPINDPGWPKGAAAIFNHTARIAYFVGPPFGGGQWTAECRGDTKAFNAVLADFAKLPVKTKPLVIHDGAGNSVWLNINNEKGGREKAKMDWSFMVWQQGDLGRLVKIEGDLPAGVRNAAKGPPVQIDVYTGFNIKWADVVVPEGIEINDQRMSAHGFSPADGNVVEGKVSDLVTKKPIAARMRLQRIEPQKTGGYQYTTLAGTVADANGHWVLTNVPEGWHCVVIEADGYVPRVAGHMRLDEQPHWQNFDTGLARPASVSGRIVDEAGQPLPDVEVTLSDVVVEGGGGYDSPDSYKMKTDAEGRFHGGQFPIGSASVWIHKPGYCKPGLGETVKLPIAGIALTMKKSARIVATIDFGNNKKPAGYMVHIAPEGGEVIGSWGGSGNINAKNQITFENIPPGRYVLYGMPNPGSEKEKTDPQTLDLKGGEPTEVTLKAKPPLPAPGQAVPPPRPPPTSKDTF